MNNFEELRDTVDRYASRGEPRGAQELLEVTRAAVRRSRQRRLAAVTAVSLGILVIAGGLTLRLRPGDVDVSTSPGTAVVVTQPTAPAGTVKTVDPTVNAPRHLLPEPPPAPLEMFTKYTGPLGGQGSSDWQISVAAPASVFPEELVYASEQLKTPHLGVQILQWSGAPFDKSMIEWRPTNRPLPAEEQTPRGLRFINLGASCNGAVDPSDPNDSRPPTTRVECSGTLVVWTDGVVAIVSYPTETFDALALANSLRVVGTEEWQSATAQAHRTNEVPIPKPATPTATTSTLPADGPFCSAWRDAYTRAQQTPDLTDPAQHDALLRMADAAPTPQIAADVRRLEELWRTSPPGPDSANVMGRVMTAGSTLCHIGTPGPNG